MSIPYGQGCPGSAGVPILRAFNRPIVGDVFRVQVENLPATATLTWITIGLSDQNSAWGPLPIDLSPMGLPSCLLLASLERVEPVQVINSPVGRIAQWSARIPPFSFFFGYTSYFQAVVFDSGSGNAVDGALSNGLKVIAGP